MGVLYVSSELHVILDEMTRRTQLRSNRILFAGRNANACSGDTPWLLCGIHGIDCAYFVSEKIVRKSSNWCDGIALFFPSIWREITLEAGRREIRKKVTHSN